MSRWGIIAWTGVLIALFLVLTNWQGANNLFGSAFRGYGGVAGILQGRSVTLGSGSVTVGGIAR